MQQKAELLSLHSTSSVGKGWFIHCSDWDEGRNRCFSAAVKVRALRPPSQQVPYAKAYKPRKYLISLGMRRLLQRMPCQLSHKTDGQAEKFTSFWP